jgi:hypothetical protein
MTTEVSIRTFNYSKLADADMTGKLLNLEGRIKRHRDGLALSVLAIGEDLCAAREVLANQKNGVFLQWLDGACGYSARTAYNYMAAYESFGKLATVASFEDVALYALASPSTPKKAVSEALKLADKGINVTGKMAKQIIKKHKPAAAPPPPPPDVVEEIAETVHEDPPEPKELTTEEKMLADNSEIEKFCRGLSKWFEDFLPDVPWINSQGRAVAARAAIKSCVNTLRASKSELCPACEDGQNRKGRCFHCLGYGYLPKVLATAIAGAKP